MEAIVYRVEHKYSSIGPYMMKSGLEPDPCVEDIFNVMEQIREVCKKHPSIATHSNFRDPHVYPGDEDKAVTIARKIYSSTPDSHQIHFGFSSIESLTEWFDKFTRKVLSKHFLIKVYEVDTTKDNFFCEFQKQLTFTRKKAKLINTLPLFQE